MRERHERNRNNNIENDMTDAADIDAGEAVGTVGGAAAGAMVGSILGPIGTAAGAVVGGALGNKAGDAVDHTDALDPANEEDR